MKNLLIIVAILTFTCVYAAGVRCQEQTSDDQKIESAVKRNAELRRRYLDELERQKKLLEEKVNRLRQENDQLDQSLSESPATNNRPAKSATAGGMASESDGSSEPLSPNRATIDNSGQKGVRSNIRSSFLKPNETVTSGATNSSAAGPQGGTSPMNGNCFAVFTATQKPNRLDQAKCFLAREMVRQGGIDLTSEGETYLLMTVLGQLAQSGKVNVAADAKSFVLDVESSRTDKQLGADPKSSGTTSLAVKGGIPTVLSWAVENGAAVASRSGTTYTFRINPVGLTQALQSQGYISGFTKAEDDTTNSFLRRTSVGFTFDTTRGTSPATLIGSKQQLSAVSVRYNFINKRDPRAREYQKLWDTFFTSTALTFTDAEAKQLKALEIPPDPTKPSTITNPEFKNRAFQKWVNDTNSAYAAQAADLKGTGDEVTDKMAAFIEQRVGNLPIDSLGQDSEVVAALTKFAQAYGPYLKAKKEILDQVAKGTLVTFEYTNFREPNAPDLSSFRFVAEKGMVGGFDFTGNASLTLYNKLRPGLGPGRIRDFDFSGQLDAKIPDVMGMGPATLSFAGKYQRLLNNAVAFDGTVLPLTKGDIAAGQIKLTIPIKDSGIKIPFSITFANRTELIREKEVRGNFGFTFDLDTLFARFKPFAPN